MPRRYSRCHHYQTYLLVLVAALWSIGAVAVAAVGSGSNPTTSPSPEEDSEHTASNKWYVESFVDGEAAAAKATLGGSSVTAVHLRGRQLRPAVKGPTVLVSSSDSSIGRDRVEKWKANRGEKGGDKSVATPVAVDDVAKLKDLIVDHEDGLIYCPIPEVASAEWQRALRWMVGVEDWEGEHSNLHTVGESGLHRLMARGLDEAKLALQSDRFFKFVVVREPAERMVSAFLNKCAFDGYLSGRIKRAGAPSCAYLNLMPDLFPNTTVASVATHERFRELMEEDPESVFFHFVSGVWGHVQQLANPCEIFNHHFRPQSCFCDLPEILPAFHVIPFANMSTEAAELANKLPEALSIQTQSYEEWSDPYYTSEDTVGAFDDEELRRRESTGVVGGVGGLRYTGVDKARRTEIGAFLSARFSVPQDEQRKVTGAVDRKSALLSTRVMDIMYKMFKQDYKLLGGYFPQSNRTKRATAV